LKLEFSSDPVKFSPEHLERIELGYLIKNLLGDSISVRHELWSLEEKLAVGGELVLIHLTISKY